MRNGDKMASKFTIIVFASLLALQQLMFIVSYVLSKFEEQPKLEKFKSNLTLYAFKLLRAISYRYNNIIVASLSFLIANVRLIESPYYKCLYLLLLLVLLYYPMSLYEKALTYTDPTAAEANSEHAFFDSLSSPEEWKLNQDLLRNRLLDELMVVLKSFLLYHCRKYKEVLLIVAVILNVLEFIIVLKFYKVIKKGFTEIKLFGIVFFTFFTLSMLIGHLTIDVPGFMFELFSLTSNLLKLVEVISSSIFMLKKNHDYKKSKTQVHPTLKADVDN
jgi:hypothetical protein